MMRDDTTTIQRALHDGWCFRRVGDEVWLPAVVPGSNFTDLLRNGRIPDPFARDNELRLQDIEREDWDYTCAFEMTAKDLPADRIDLVFDGLDTFCEVRLNGALLLSADNMFRSWRIDCGAHLREGTNDLALRFRSPVVAGEHRASGDDFKYPAENDKTAGMISPYVRKAPYHFGWDWGPKFSASGIWRPVRLEMIRGGRIAGIAHRIVSLTDDRAEVEFVVDVDAKTDEPLMVSIAGVAAPVQDGRAVVPIVIDSPRLWWPNGLGEPHLYDFDVALTLQATVLDRSVRTIGLRTIEVVNRPDDHGESFFVEVNGRPVFMKGANYIPPDSFLETVTPDRVEQLFRDCTAAHFNMLRVWGGGTYESDLFYDCADRHGILIWQDFMFACTLYPADPAFLASVRAEATEAVRRLLHHPCLALWCGNNEVGLGIAEWDWPEKFGYSAERWAILLAGNKRLFDDLLPGIVAEHDPDRFYFPSSPIGHWGTPADDGRGDGHYWGVWHGELPFQTYAERITRFMSEYGFQSYPLLASIERFTDPADRVVGSPALNVHQKHGRGDAIIGRFIRQSLGEPADFEQFCYLSQIVQADGLRVAFEAHRRNMPVCMGSLYWQVNDCWPAISWSSIDYYGRWKALHYQAARSFAPVILSIEEKDGALLVHGVSDSIEALAGTLIVDLHDDAGAHLKSWSFAAELGGDTAKVMASIASGEIEGDGVIVRARLLAKDGPALAENIQLLAPASTIALVDPELAVEIVDEATVRVSAKRFAKAVHVIATVPDAARTLNFADNFFDLLPGDDRLIATRDGTAFDPASVRVVSLYDMRVPPAIASDREPRRYGVG